MALPFVFESIVECDCADTEGGDFASEDDNGERNRGDDETTEELLRGEDIFVRGEDTFARGEEIFDPAFEFDRELELLSLLPIAREIVPIRLLLDEFVESIRCFRLTFTIGTRAAVCLLFIVVAVATAVPLFVIFSFPPAFRCPAVDRSVSVPPPRVVSVSVPVLLRFDFAPPIVNDFASPRPIPSPLALPFAMWSLERKTGTCVRV